MCVCVRTCLYGVCIYNNIIESLCDVTSFMQHAEMKTDYPPAYSEQMQHYPTQQSAYPPQTAYPPPAGYPPQTVGPMPPPPYQY